MDTLTVKLSKGEELVLEDWASKVQYNAFCHVLHSGVNLHLQVESTNLSFQFMLVIRSLSYLSFDKLNLSASNTVLTQ